jgi:spermidine synthase
VRARLPPPRGAQVRVRIGDARDVAGRLPAGLQGTADLVVSDVFAGAQTPAHLTTVEYFRILGGLLAPDGVLLVNVADGADSPSPAARSPPCGRCFPKSSCSRRCRR